MSFMCLVNMNVKQKKNSLQEDLEKFAELFDPPLKIIRRKSKNNSNHFFCIYTQDGEQLHFEHIGDDGNYGNGCFFNEMSSWNTWQEMFAIGGTLNCIHEIEPWKKYKTILHYVIPKFDSLEELKIKLAIIGPQFPKEIVR